LGERPPRDRLHPPPPRRLSAPVASAQRVGVDDPMKVVDKPRHRLSASTRGGGVTPPRPIGAASRHDEALRRWPPTCTPVLEVLRAETIRGTDGRPTETAVIETARAALSRLPPGGFVHAAAVTTDAHARRPRWRFPSEPRAPEIPPLPPVSGVARARHGPQGLLRHRGTAGQPAGGTIVHAVPANREH
jgi:hypothetical protein